MLRESPHSAPFVELPDKKVGLVHISEVANEYVKDVHDFLKVGDKDDCKVLNVDDRGKSDCLLNKLRRVAKKTLNRNAKSFDPSPSFVSGNSIHNAAPEDRPPLKIG